MTQAAVRIRQAATRKPKEKLTALLHHITTEALDAPLKKEAVDGAWHGEGSGRTAECMTGFRAERTGRVRRVDETRPLHQGPRQVGVSGYRPGRVAQAREHDRPGFRDRGVRWIVDADIRSYFDRTGTGWSGFWKRRQAGYPLDCQGLNAGVMKGANGGISGHSAGCDCFADSGERLFALCPRPVVPQEVARPNSRRQHNHREVRR